MGVLGAMWDVGSHLVLGMNLGPHARQQHSLTILDY